jgi:hypothetical protein
MCSSIRPPHLRFARQIVAPGSRGVVGDSAIVFEDRRIVSNVKAPDIARRIEDMFAAMVFLGTVRASEPCIPEAGALTLYISPERGWSAS